MAVAERKLSEYQLNDITQQIAQSYRSVYGDSIVAIYLYGSYAKGCDCLAYCYTVW